MNNEIAPVLDMLEELKQECKAIIKAQTELRTTLAEQPANPIAERVLLLLVCGLIMVSCWFFAMGSNKLQTASDYDLRYRYLRMQGKATSKDFVHLDSLFVTHRNPKAIQQVQQKVVDYEQALQRQAELLLQQKRIKEEQAGLQKHLKQ